MEYSLADLERLAGVTARTVRYYVAQGLLPSPGAGRTARYSDGHLARLRLIRRLQREHLPLAEIRRRLEALSDDEIAQATAAEAPIAHAPPADSAVEYARRVLAESAAPYDVVSGLPPMPPPQRLVPYPKPPRPTSTEGIPAPSVAPASSPVPPPSPAPGPFAPWAPPPAPSGPPPATPSARVEPSSGPPVPLPASPDRSTWERIVLAPDVELHVRRPLDRPTAKQVDRLVRIGRELLSDEP